MVTAWTSSKLVVSRILRNIKGVEADYVDSIPEWIAEGVRKLKTKYSLEIRCKEVNIKFHLSNLNIPAESIFSVTSGGGRLKYNVEGMNYQNFHARNNFLENLFVSDVPIYSTAGDPIQSLDDYTGGNPFPRDIIQRLYTLPWIEHEWWYLNGTKIQTSMECATIRVWYRTIPVDEHNFPLIPDVEHYQEALYWYNRMKLIEAGFEDKVMNHQMAKAEWNDWAGKAISQISYPTVEQMDEQIMRHLNMFPHEYHWGAHVDWNWGGRVDV